MSLDALRGLDMFWIIGGEGLFAPLAALTGWQIWRYGEQQVQHTPWNGFTFYDLIFPLFIFLSGVTLGLSPKYLPDLPWTDRRKHYLRAVRRLVLLVLLGIVYNHAWGRGIPMHPGQIRFASVLGRIGVAWFVAAMLAWHIRSWKKITVIAAGILLGYWAVVAGLGNQTPEGSIHAWIDQHFLPGIRYQNRPYDPEGLLSNATAVVNALLGYLAGRWLRRDDLNGWVKSGMLLLAGAALLGAGWLWNPLFPVNKEIWTSSFVLVTCGWGAMLLAVFYAIIDVGGLRRPAWPLAVIGANAIVVYLASSLIDWEHTASGLFGGLIGAAPGPWQDLLGVLALLLVQWVPLAWLYHRRIHIRV
jgi:predicted acyltransferase